VFNKMGSPAMRRPFIAFALFGLLAVFTGQAAQAQYVVTLPTDTIGPNQQVTFDVLISPGASTTLSNYGIEIDLSGPNSDVVFSATQPDYTGDANYVFFNNSFDHQNTINPVTGLTTTSYASFDIASPSPVTVSPGQLLVEFSLTSAATITPAENFTLTVNPVNTSYVDGGGNNQTATYTGGLIVTSSVASTPEPGSLALIAGVGGIAALTRYGRRFRNRGPAKADDAVA
jgi:hypothetical protein